MEEFSLFESENNPLRESMKQMLEQLPHNSEQVKSIFKSLLLVHISKIKDSEERSTWQSFVNTLDNMSQSDQAVYSFGPMTSSNDFKAFLRHKKCKADPFEFYFETLKAKAFGTIKRVWEITQMRKEKLKKIILVSMRLRYVEAFWKWHMLTAGLEHIADEFYQKNVKSLIFTAFKKAVCEQDKGFMYWKLKTALRIMVSWAEVTRDSFREKIRMKKSTNFNREDGIRPKYGPRSESAEKIIGNKGKEFFSRNKHQSRPKPQQKNWKKRVLDDVRKRFELKLEKRRSRKLLQAWVNITKSSIFVEKLVFALNLPLLRFGFEKIFSESAKLSPMQLIKQKYSIDNLSDYELSVKITILERRLAGLHQELLSEQITNRSLLSEKEQLYKLLD